MAGTPQLPLQQGGTWKNEEKKKKKTSWDLKYFGLIRGELRSYFMFSWGDSGGGCTPFVCHAFSSVSIVNFEQVSAGWVTNTFKCLFGMVNQVFRSSFFYILILLDISNLIYILMVNLNKEVDYIFF